MTDWKELHEALATAWVRGWYAGCDGATTDDGKVEVARELAAKLTGPQGIDAHYTSSTLTDEIVRLRELVVEMSGVLEECAAAERVEMDLQLSRGRSIASALGIAAQHARNAVAKAKGAL